MEKLIMMEYKYDVAISFAEEDRNAALALALALEIKGINNVYYYPLHYESTWGENIKEKLQEIYSLEARYAIVLLSRKYFAKEFAAIELDAIKKRMKLNTSVVYMLPLLLDNLNDEVIKEYAEFGYLEWEFNAKEIAETIVKLLGKEKIVVSEYKQDGSVTLLKNLLIETKDVHIGNIGNTIQYGNDTKIMKDSIIKSDTFHFGNKEK
ncbi:MAG: TIR domain-containing protein [Ferruginibacter sp.]